jgi:hypothetical protein
MTYPSSQQVQISWQNLKRKNGYAWSVQLSTGTSRSKGGTRIGGWTRLGKIFAKNLASHECSAYRMGEQAASWVQAMTMEQNESSPMFLLQ